MVFLWLLINHWMDKCKTNQRTATRTTEFVRGFLRHLNATRIGFANFNPYSVELERHVESGRRPKCQFRMGLLSACQSVSEDKHGLGNGGGKEDQINRQLSEKADGRGGGADDERAAALSQSGLALHTKLGRRIERERREGGSFVGICAGAVCGNTGNGMRWERKGSISDIPHKNTHYKTYFKKSSTSR